MVTISDLDKIALKLKFIDDVPKKVSHYKVNRKIYDFMKIIEHSSIIYHTGYKTLLLNKKPVFIDDELEDGVAVYEYKEQFYPCVECGEPLTLAKIQNEQHQGFCSHHCALTCVGFVVTDNGYLPKDEAEELS